ncbi:AAA family ATPase [Methylovorus menthalis]|uniref:AAA family ATPase n=1 Tax=Methylovorus menthalis TaxID=1002227 RepID=UPI001E594557|nr:AAA family ATPase [Methylovorus menthalis]MCB4811064.1 AAA family ATPase [Methylovorus menthalis]
MIRSEYFRFLQILNTPSIPEAVRKIANLVAANLDELVPLSTYQGQRIRRLVALAQTNWEAISPDIQPIPENDEEQVAKFSQLKRMTVGPFRGFARQEVFDLASRLVLIYGPNGTGKSSFCEALEYGLLGNVVEADSKRFRDQNEYLKNAYVDQFSPPDIYADDGQGNEIAVTSNETAYRFCFVEKNRIDSFSRIAAQAPAKQTELISTLFGLESFTEFVHNFTAEIDDRYIDIVGRKASLLVQKQQALSGARQQTQSSNNDLQIIASEEVRLANQYREGANFSQMVLELNGSDETPGTIERLEIELQQPIATKSNLTRVALEALGNSIATTIQEMNGKQQELAAASQQVSFKKLYEAVTQVQPSSPSACPACKTSLAQVAINPYTNADQELQKLQQLAAIQHDAGQLEQSAKQSLFHLSQILNTCLKSYPQNNPIKSYEVENNGQPSIHWWDSLHHKISDGFTPWQHLASQVQHLEESDKQIDQAAQQRSNKQIELNKLREYAHQITVLQTRRQTANATIASVQQLIDNFQNENVQLITDVEAEKAVISRNQAITSAYVTFVRKLNDYSNNLPAQLVADLGETVVALYNAFNRNDAHTELLANVTLPLAQNQRLKIAFQNQPNKLYDALHVLSEGHIRCLGLAILLAKNLKENAPVLIFDDPVNAIDDDHRESIRRTLFEDQYFSDKQILLTCHGEEFFKDIQNLLPAQAASQAKSFSFLPRLGDPHIRVDFNCAPRNYILAARGHINRNEIREALAKSRQALESLTKNKVWRYVTRYGDGTLSLKLRSSSAPIELRNLTEQLKSKIGKNDFADPNKNSVFTPIDTLLGLNGESREWRYLNKGTHEENDRAEFDRNTVQTIIANLEQLDAALT